MQKIRSPPGSGEQETKTETISGSFSFDNARKDTCFQQCSCLPKVVPTGLP